MVKKNLKRPLEGFLVLDWTNWQQGPIASVMLGDLGADVIKIEQRGVGDPARGMMKVSGTATGLAGRNFYFEMMNRNKKSLTVDLNKPEGKKVIYDLVKKADVFVQNFRQGVAAKQGLDYATLSKINPRLVYASASGWGAKGPDATKPSFDYTGQARSGIMYMTGEPDMPPQLINGGTVDQLGGMMTAYGVVSALLNRERTGEGQELNASLLGAMTWLQGLRVAMKLIMGTEGPRQARARNTNPLWNHYLCKDGKWIALAHLQPDRYWASLCKALGMEQYEKDPKFATLAERGKNCVELIAIMDKIFASKTKDEWYKILEKTDLVFQSINTIADLVNDPQAIANGYITDFDHPVLGKIKMVGSPVTFSKSEVGPRSEAPEFGQHTEEILTDVLGYSWDDVGKLKDSEVI